MIQAVVTRLGTDSFLVKGWAITVAGAFFGFTFSVNNWRLATVSCIPTFVFWCLDTYFLRSERSFRLLYDHVIAVPQRVAPFFMSATSQTFISSLSPQDREKTSWWRSFVRPTMLVLYGGLLAAALLVAALSAQISEQSRSGRTTTTVTTAHP